MSPDQIFLTVNGRRLSLAKLLENPAAATVVRVENCAGLTALPDLPAATVVRVLNCAGLTALPDLPAATDVRVLNCAGLTALYAGKDSRGYQFYCAKIRGQWRVVAGCKILTIEEARAYCGPGGRPGRPDLPSDCLALVEKLATAITEAA